MEISKSLNLCVVGLGKVGMSIAQMFAQAGFSVLGVDVNEDNIERGLEAVTKNLDYLGGRGKIAGAEKAAILSRLGLGADFNVVCDADVIIEAVFEDMKLKKELFAQLDETVEKEDALLLTNTSSLSVSEIASATGRPQQVAGMHFFNPVPVMKLVEVVKGTLTSEQTIEHVRQLAILSGKKPIVSADSPGFIVNRMLNALVVEATRIVQEGVGTVEDVDTGAKLGLGHPMGPLELFDYLNAIHLLEHVTDYMSQELGDRFRLPVWVKNLVRAGKIGRKTGGFYTYE